jgi:hypothetical protein
MILVDRGSFCALDAVASIGAYVHVPTPQG